MSWHEGNKRFMGVNMWTVNGQGLTVELLQGIDYVKNTLGENTETPIQKNLCTPMFIAAQFTIAKYRKQP